MTTFDNYQGQTILQDTWNGVSGGGSQHQDVYNYYDSYGNVTDSHQPLAVASWSVSGATLSVSVNSSSGLVDVNQYDESSTTATTSTAGNVLGYLEESGVNLGSGGSTVWQLSMDYKANTTTNSVFYTNSSTVHSTAGDGGQTTDFTYSFFSSCYDLFNTYAGPADRDDDYHASDRRRDP